METLIRSFARAHLPLELRAVPLTWDRWESAEDIVQIDITREAKKNRPLERFRVYPGHASNRLEVLDVDTSLRQLVLAVDEAERSFAVAMSRRASLPEGATIVRRSGETVWVEQRTDGRLRHFLCGMDEAHLFIAMLPFEVDTVEAAHEALRPPIVSELEARTSAPTVRQGEWFFVALPASEEREVSSLARRTLPVRRNVGIAEAAGIRRIGRPHVAEEVLVVKGIPDAAGDTSERVYVRGSVRHPDHRTIVLPAWRRTIENRESISAPVEGIDWID